MQRRLGEPAAAHWQARLTAVSDGDPFPAERPHMPRPLISGVLLAVLGTLLLTPDTLFMRLSGMGGFQMVAWRGLLMGAALLGVWAVIARGRRGADLAALAKPAGLTAMGCQVINASLFSTGVAVAPVSVVLFGVATVPVFASVLAGLLYGERTSRATWRATAAVLAGIALAVFGSEEGGLQIDLATLYGAVAGLGVAATIAYSFVLIRHHADLPILPVIGGGALLAGLLGTAVAGPAALGEGAVWAIAVSGLLILPVSFFAITLATRRTHATTVSLIMLLEAVLGPLWVWIGVGEAPTAPMLIGGAVVVASLALYLLGSSRHPL